MSNRIISEGAEFNLETAMAATDNGDNSELAIAAWWTNSLSFEATTCLELADDSRVRQLIKSGILHAVSYKKDAQVVINGEEANITELLEPTTPKPPNADWYDYDDERSKNRVLSHLEDPRTRVPSYNLQNFRYDWLGDMTPAYAHRQRLVVDFDTVLAGAIENVHRYAGMFGDETGLAVVSAKNESSLSQVSWQGEVTVIDGGLGIPHQLAAWGKQGVRIGNKTNRWSPERQQAVANDSDFALNSLLHLTGTKFMGVGHDGVAGRDSDIDAVQGWGIWALGHGSEAVYDLTIATTDEAIKGAANVAVTVKHAQEPVEKALSLPSLAKGTLVHVSLHVERQDR